MSRSRPAAKIGLVLLGLFLALAGVELLMRAAALIHALGVRGAAQDPRGGNTATILCLGESTTAPTWGADHSWPRQLSDVLAAAGGPKFEIVNRTVGGTNSEFIEGLLPSYLEQYKPAMVIAMIGVNDSKWYGILRGDGTALGKTRNFLQRFRTFKALRYAYHEFLRRGEAAEPEADSTAHRDNVVRIIRARRIPLILMQYPGFDVGLLQEHFSGQDGIVFVDNKSSFDKALAAGSYRDFFKDSFGGNWGHCTTRGDRLIAENAAEAVKAVAGGGTIQYSRKIFGRRGGDNAQAERALRKTLEDQPDNLAALRGLVELALDRPGEALALADRAARAAAKAPRAQRVPAYLESARIHRQLKDEAGAEALLRQALRASPDDFDALHMMVELKRRDPKEAVAFVEQAADFATKSSPQHGEAILDCVRLFMELKDVPGAEKVLAKALAAAPEEPAYLEMMVEVKGDRLSEALPYADRGAAAARRAHIEDRLQTALSAAKVHLGLKDRPGAEALLRRALAENPGNLDALNLLAELKKDSPREALAFSDQALLAASRLPTPDRLPIYLRNAKLRLILKDVPGAERLVKRALAENPDSLDALRMMVDLLGDRPRDAMAYVDRAAHAALSEPGPRLEAVSLECAHYHIQFKDKDGAESVVKKALESKPDSFELLGLMVDLAQDRPREALAYADRALALARRGRTLSRLPVQQARARLLLYPDDKTGAEAALKRGLESDPDDLEALAMLARLTLGRREEAMAYADRLERAALKAQNAQRASALLECARIRLDLKDAAGAEGALKGALGASPENVAALRLMMDLKRGRPREALDYVARTVRAARKDALQDRLQIYSLGAKIHLELGDRDGAEQILQLALELEPDDPEALKLLLQIRRDAPDKALPLLGRAERAAWARPPGRRRAEILDCARYRRQFKDDAGAESVLKRELERQPEDMEALRMLVGLKLDQPGEALTLLARAPRPSASNRLAWLMLRSQVRSAAKNTAGAEADLKEALSISPRASCLETPLVADKSRMDLFYFDLCLDRFPDDPGLRLDRGVARYLRGLKPGALADFRRAVELKPELLEAELSLASLLMEEGEDAQALAAADKAVALAKGGLEEPVYKRILSLQTLLRGRRNRR